MYCRQQQHQKSSTFLVGNSSQTHSRCNITKHAHARKIRGSILTWRYTCRMIHKADFVKGKSWRTLLHIVKKYVKEQVAA